MTAPSDPNAIEQWKRGISERTKKWMSDPDHRMILRLRKLGKKLTEEHKKKIGDSLRGRKHFENGNIAIRGENNPSKRPEVRLKKSLKLRGRKLSPDTIALLIKCNTGRKASAETRMKMSESHKGDKCHLWKGGISFEPYCPKFTKPFKERVRAFYNYQCFECGTPHSISRLHVHHIAYNKDTCCDDSIPLFVALCNSCHGKTQGNRGWWQSYFTKLIVAYHGNKTFLTKEEFSCLFQ